MNAPGYISSTELYTLAECQKRLRLGRHSFRRLRQAGLEVLQIGRCHYVAGDSLISTLKKLATEKHETVMDENEQHEREITGAL